MKDLLTPRERFGLLVIDEPQDRVPVFPLVTAHAARVAGIPVREYYTDGMAMARSQLVAQETYGIDFISFFSEVGMVAEALGSQFDYPEDDLPLLAKPKWTDLAQLDDRLADPLTHLVRNAIDHGIEPADQRLAAGKSAEGHLRLDAYHESGMIVIEVADDGHGLNTQRIREKAVARGLIDAQANLSDHDVQMLIFAAGFSTADNVSDLSGRGVGMDVVRSAIDALRGTIEIDSRPGEGCTFRIRLPLTLAIIDGFLISLGDDYFVIPLDMVTECLELEADQLDGAAYGYLDLRGRPLPCLSLAAHFKLREAPSKRRNIIVVSHGRQQAGLIVDHLHGELQTVIKPLGQLFQHLQGIGGSTILGSGQVALILDIPSLFRHLHTHVEASPADLRTSQPRQIAAGQQGETPCNSSAT